MACFVGLSHPRNKLRWSLVAFFLVMTAACLGGFVALRGNCVAEVEEHLRDQDLHTRLAEKIHSELHFPGEEISEEALIAGHDGNETGDCPTTPSVTTIHCFKICNAMVGLYYAMLLAGIAAVIPLLVMCLCTTPPKLEDSGSLQTSSADVEAPPPGSVRDGDMDEAADSSKVDSGKVDSMKLPTPPVIGVPAVWSSSNSLDGASGRRGS